MIQYESKTEFIGESEDNDTYDTASPLELNVVNEGNYSKLGDIDIYQFEMERPGLAEIWGKDSNDYFYFTLYEEDVHGNIYEITGISSYARVRLGKGRYFLEVEPGHFQKSREYKICADVTYESAEEYEQESNNIRSDANVKNLNTWYTGNLSTANDIDYFKFSVPEKSYLALELRVPRQVENDVLKITLYDSNMQRLCYASNTSNPYLKTEEIIAEAGDYYVRTECGDNSSYYLNADYSFLLNQRKYVPGGSAISPGGEQKPGNQENQPHTQKIQLNKKSSNVVVGKSVKLQLKGASGKITWRSSNNKIASVSAKGTVKTKRIGAVTITASYGGKKYTCKITVKPKFKKVCLYGYSNGGFYFWVHSVKGGRMTVSIHMPYMTRKKMKANINADGKTATAKFKCKNGRTHKLTMKASADGNKVKVIETAGCSKKLLSMKAENRKKKISHTFYPSSHYYY
ncbi:Ig-like domain-containing protein [Lachnospiraceae bacterium 48-42]|jgi:Bacterial Ig-like domain (group 2).|nr:Ig-like domain-containing protein [Dorea sp.]